MSVEVFCDGSVFCQIGGHVKIRRIRDGYRHTHILLTAAQERDIKARREAARTTEQDRTDDNA